jgi:hypothetical protein
LDAPALPAHMRGLLALNPSCPAPRHSAGNGVDSCYTIYTQVLEQHGIFKQEPRVRCQKDSKSRALCDSKKSSGKKYTAYTAHISSPREKKTLRRQLPGLLTWEAFDLCFSLHYANCVWIPKKDYCVSYGQCQPKINKTPVYILAVPNLERSGTHYGLHLSTQF